MKKVEVPPIAGLDDIARPILEAAKKKMGMVPNLYATIGYSSAALKSMLDTDAALSHENSFSAKDREAINLIVSQVNHCDYCLAAHTALAKMRGFSEAETLDIRRAEFADHKLNTVILLAKDISENKGAADPSALQSFFDEGYDEKSLIELIALISLRTFTNYVFSNTHIPIDFPMAPSLS